MPPSTRNRPEPAIQIFAAIFLFALLFAMIQVGLLTVAFDKLGLSSGSAMVLLFGSLLGSSVNLPLFQINSDVPPERPEERHPLLRMLQPPFTGRTIVAVNLGGCLIPLTFSLYLLTHRPLPLGDVLLATALQTVVCFAFSRPIPKIGIGMPFLIAPIAAAIIAIMVDKQHSAPLAYIAGTWGVLLGADLLRMKDIRGLGVPVASIGGGGTFDGVFITGIVAVLLA